MNDQVKQITRESENVLEDTTNTHSLTDPTSRRFNAWHAFFFQPMVAQMGKNWQGRKNVNFSNLEKGLDFKLSQNQMPMERTTENDRNPFDSFN